MAANDLEVILDNFKSLRTPQGINASDLSLMNEATFFEKMENTIDQLKRVLLKKDPLINRLKKFEHSQTLVLNKLLLKLGKVTLKAHFSGQDTEEQFCRYITAHLRDAYLKESYRYLTRPRTLLNYIHSRLIDTENDDSVIVKEKLSELKNILILQCEIFNARIVIFQRSNADAARVLFETMSDNRNICYYLLETYKACPEAKKDNPKLVETWLFSETEKVELAEYYEEEGIPPKSKCRIM